MQIVSTAVEEYIHKGRIYDSSNQQVHTVWGTSEDDCKSQFTTAVDTLLT